MAPKVVKTEAEWRDMLSDEQYHVTRKHGTERAFTGIYWDNHDEGQYRHDLTRIKRLIFFLR